MNAKAEKRFLGLCPGQTLQVGKPVSIYVLRGTDRMIARTSDVVKWYDSFKDGTLTIETMNTIYKSSYEHPAENGYRLYGFYDGMAQKGCV